MVSIRFDKIVRTFSSGIGENFGLERRKRTIRKSTNQKLLKSMCSNEELRLFLDVVKTAMSKIETTSSIRQKINSLNQDSVTYFSTIELAPKSKESISLDDIEALYQKLRRLHGFDCISVTDVIFTDATFTAFLSLISVLNLSKIYFHNCDLDDDKMTILAKYHFKDYFLKDNKITDKGLEILAGVITNGKEIENINLTGNPCTGKGIIGLVEALASGKCDLRVSCIKNLNLIRLRKILWNSNINLYLQPTSSTYKPRSENGHDLVSYRVEVDQEEETIQVRVAEMVYYRNKYREVSSLQEKCAILIKYHQLDCLVIPKMICQNFKLHKR